MTTSPTTHDLAEAARDAVSQAFNAERSRYRSVELARAAQALDALVETLRETAHDSR